MNKPTPFDQTDLVKTMPLSYNNKCLNIPVTNVGNVILHKTFVELALQIFEDSEEMGSEFLEVARQHITFCGNAKEYIVQQAHVLQSIHWLIANDILILDPDKYDEALVPFVTKTYEGLEYMVESLEQQPEEV